MSGGIAIVANKVRLADPLSNQPAAILHPVAVPTNGAGAFTIAAGGSAQLLAAANAVRRGWWLQNHSTGDLWVGKTGSASAGAPHVKIAAGGLYECPMHMVSGGTLHVFGATTGQAFSFEEA